MPAATLIDALNYWTDERPDAPLFTFLEDGDTQESKVSVREYRDRAYRLATHLRQHCRRGDRVMLLYAPGIEYMVGFFGCLIAGAYAVPAYPPDVTKLSRSLPRLLGIIRDAGASVLLTSSDILPMFEAMAAGIPELAGVKIIATDALTGAPQFDFPKPRVDDIAFLQYTSGSTGSPKGTMLTHLNLTEVMNSIITAYGGFRFAPHHTVVSWLPPYHDLGLISKILLPIWWGIHAVHMSPLHFLHTPMRWLRAISRYKALWSNAPNFAYDLCARRATPEEIAALDLSNWKCAINGAEPVRESTLRRFAETFAPAGFKETAFFGSYGLAEATLMVTSRNVFVPASVIRKFDAERLADNHAVPADSGRTLVSSGVAGPGSRVAIVRSGTNVPCQPGEVGDVWVANKCVALGYWGRPEQSEQTFKNRLENGDGPFLNTGDLGFVLDDELFFTGRKKDVLVVRGRNFYPSDLERFAEALHPALRPGCSAAFSVEEDDEERVVFVAELDRRYQTDRRAMEKPGELPAGAEHRRGVERRANQPAVDALSRPAEERQEAVRASARPGAPGVPMDQISEEVIAGFANEFGIEVSELLLIKPGSIPKTSSGKIQRFACRDALLADSFESIFRWKRPKRLLADAGVRAVISERATLKELSTERRRERVKEILVDELAYTLKIDASSVGDKAPFMTLGLTSLAGVELRQRIEARTGVLLMATAPYNYPTVEALAGFVADDLAGLTPGQPTSRSKPPPAAPTRETSLAEELELAKSLIGEDDEK